MKKTNRVILSFIAIALICACVIFMLAACNFNQQQSVPNNSNGNNTSNNNTSDNNANNDNNKDNNNQPSNPVDKDEENTGKPDKPVTPPEEEQDISKTDFFKDVSSEILSGYNKRAPSYAQLEDLEILAINSRENVIYYKAKLDNNEKFGYATMNGDIAAETYKDTLENIKSSTIEFARIASRQEQSLANEIAAFALEQQEVKDYLSANGIDPTEIEVLNATQFESINGYRTTNLIICSQNSIFNIRLAGRTGACSSQKSYLEELQKIGVERLEIGEAISFEELKIEDGSAASVYEITLPSGIGDFLFNQTYYTED